MMMLPFAHLHELDSPAEMVDHFLKSPRVPPLRGIVVFPPRHDDPERRVISGDLVYLRDPRFLKIREVDITTEIGGFNVQRQTVVEMLDKAEEEMVWQRVTLMDERILTRNRQDIRVV